ncbi:unnamed protein product, partial [marine sediment metagenome]
LLKLISKLTEKIENGVSKDVIKGSIPDAAIYDNSTVILIEAKTQIPLYRNTYLFYFLNILVFYFFLF